MPLKAEGIAVSPWFLGSLRHHWVQYGGIGGSKAILLAAFSKFMHIPLSNAWALILWVPK
jgi:hypothetical protein